MDSAVIFDVDGVLVDTARPHFERWAADAVHADVPGPQYFAARSSSNVFFSTVIFICGMRPSIL